MKQNQLSNHGRPRRQWHARIWLVFLCSLIAGGAVYAQPDPIQVHQTQVKAISVLRQTQQSEENWAQRKGELKAQYKSLKSEKKMLEKEKSVAEKQIEILAARQAEAERKIIETAHVGEKLQDHLDGIIVRLEEKISRDLPFLMLERTERLKRVKETMVQPEADIAEKCRQVMEALKIETEYGQTVEVYPEAIRVDGLADDAAVMADILRLGRLALFWRTPDGQHVGCWNRADGQWSLLPDKYRRRVNDAMEMALKHRTIEMVKLPLGRIVVQ